MPIMLRCGGRGRRAAPAAHASRRAKDGFCATAPPSRPPADDGLVVDIEAQHLTSFNTTRDLDAALRPRMSSRTSLPARQDPPAQAIMLRGRAVRVGSYRFQAPEQESIDETKPVPPENDEDEDGPLGWPRISAEASLVSSMLERIEDCQVRCQRTFSRHRKRSTVLFDSMDKLVELLHDYEKLCTDELKWGYMVIQVDRIVSRTRALVDDVQRQTFMGRMTSFRSNGKQYDKVGSEIGDTIKDLRFSVSGWGPVERSSAHLEERDRKRRKIRQIPGPPRHFMGRRHLLDSIIAQLAADKNEVQLCILSGLRGNGKTAVANALVARVADKRPDAHFFADLLGGDVEIGTGDGARGRSSSAAAELTQGLYSNKNVNETMRTVIRAQGGAAELATSTQELQSMYHDVFSSRRTILMLENAIDAKQVQALLPRTGKCLVVVTSIRNLGDDATLRSKVTCAKNIAPLSESEGHQMLKSLDPRLKQEELLELTALCGCMPLALQVVGGALSIRPDVAPSKIIKKLRKEAEGGVVPSGELSRTIFDSLHVSYDLLTDGPTGSRAILQQLSVFPDTFDMRAAAAVLGLDEDMVQQHLGELLVNNLVELAPVEGRYHVRKVIREFAKSMRMQSQFKGEIQSKVFEERFMQVRPAMIPA